jgi:Uma2 family endonuclease
LNMAKRTTSSIQISDEELLKISSANPNMRFELVEGELVAMTPVGGHTGELEAQINAMVVNWCNQNKVRGFSPSTGFKLSNGNVRSPDAAVLLPTHSAYNQKFEGFVPGAPDFLIEIRSKSDPLQSLKQKMSEWIESGCRLAFLIDPVERKAYVYRKDLSVTEYPYTAKLTGEDVVEGLTLCPADIDPQN